MKNKIVSKPGQKTNLYICVSCFLMNIILTGHYYFTAKEIEQWKLSLLFFIILWSVFSIIMNTETVDYK